jgi:hypothetical protein
VANALQIGYLVYIIISPSLLQLLRIAGHLPSSTALVTAVVAVPALFMLWLVDGQFRRSDQSWAPPGRGASG